MKAVRIHEYGPAETLKVEEIARPVPGPGDALVRVHAVALNSIDWKIRAGHLQSWLKYQFPFTPGWDFSGVIESVGNDVKLWKPGEEVYGLLDISGNGAGAEFVLVPSDRLAAKPKSVDHVHAAAVPLAGLTAWQALFDTAQLLAGQSVLIHAGAGGVGTFAVQLAKWKGAHVYATASGANQDFLRSLGVDQPIDYTTTRFEDVVKGVDVVVDSMAGETRERSWQVLKRGGFLVSLLGQGSLEQASAHGVRATIILVKSNLDELEQMADLIDAGKLKPVVGAEFPLEQAVEAHRLGETNHARGKIVLKVV
jgi:NADPH:quinone reductase-like Zn-dependent oxidoreductase